VGEEDQPVGLEEGHGPQKHPVRQTEDGRVRADPQSQAEESGEGEGRLAPEETEGVSEIVEERTHGLSGLRSE